MIAGGTPHHADDDLGHCHAPPGEGYFRFLRYGHILSSLLRELLEDRFLGELSTHPLTRAQFCFLKLITLNADVQIGEVARCLGVTAAASSKTIDKLVMLGLVTRTPSTEDRRATMLKATDAGRRLVRDFEDLKASRLWPVIDALGDDRRQLLCELLEEVCVNILDQERHLNRTCMRCAGYFHADCTVGRHQGECGLRDARVLSPKGPV
ncbi:MAG: winged helix DNA-binding protein [bacterium]|nr:winged helix DNA-binding protein [bacterium]